MRYTEFKSLPRLFEMAADVVDNLKVALADKIKTLPADDATIKTLREIEDLLRDVNAGGRKGLIFKDLQTIDDPAVHAAQKDIARLEKKISAFGKKAVKSFALAGAATAAFAVKVGVCLLYTSPSPRDRQKSRMPSSA